MIKEILPNIFTFEVVLPKSPLKALNSYVIKDKNKTILFDTGFNQPESEASLRAGLSELEVELQDVTLMLTHLHSDHCGLAHIFQEAGADIYASSIDGQYIESSSDEYGHHWQSINTQKELFGMKPDEIHLHDNPGFKYRSLQPIRVKSIDPGDRLNVSNYNFEIIDLIGHTPGHIGFYEPTQKILIGGDTVLDPMTPNITFWGEEYPSILGSYIDTLQRIKALDLKMILPTHRKIITNVNERIDVLIYHHHQRLQEILDVMQKDRCYSTRDISAKISWRIKANDWDDFPRGQKWFAAGETLAHLDYLKHNDYVEMQEDSNGTLLFKKIRSQVSLLDIK